VCRTYITSVVLTRSVAGVIVGRGCRRAALSRGLSRRDAVKATTTTTPPPPHPCTTDGQYGQCVTNWPLGTTSPPIHRPPPPQATRATLWRSDIVVFVLFWLELFLLSTRRCNRCVFNVFYTLVTCFQLLSGHTVRLLTIEQPGLRVVCCINIRIDTLSTTRVYVWSSHLYKALSCKLCIAH